MRHRARRLLRALIASRPLHYLRRPLLVLSAVLTVGAVSLALASLVSDRFFAALSGAAPGQDLVPDFRRVAKSNVRYRSLCQLPLLHWSDKNQLWIPPMCRFALVYNGFDPRHLSSNLTDDREPFRQITADHLGTDGLHIWVKDRADFAALAALGGSDFPELHWPSVLLVDHISGSKYLFQLDAGSTSAPELASVSGEYSEFLQEVQARRWPQFLKQETIEDMPADGGTSVEHAPLHINSLFFEQYIANSTRRVASLREKELFVTFHAPWCGHCRVFLSKFEPLAKQILKVAGPTIGFYKLDVTANDVSEARFRISQVPTTLFFSQHDSEPIELKERRDVRTGLIAFLHKHSRQLHQAAYSEL